MIEKVKTNKNFILGIIVGIILTATTGVVAYSVYANTVTYDNTQSGLQSTNVQGAIDELYDKTKNMAPIDLDTFQTNTSKTIYASKLGVCIKRKNKLNCFKINNWDIEKEHIQQVFSDVSCSVDSSTVRCDTSSLVCLIYSYGRVRCGDHSASSYCDVNSDGSVNCT